MSIRLRERECVMGAPILIDLCCCLGGASEGYRRAGFRVLGVDVFLDYRQTDYPFPSVRMDAVEFIWRLVIGDKVEFLDPAGISFLVGLSDVAAWAASPPCQHASAATRAIRRSGRQYVRLVEPVRYALQQTGQPYVIENVKGAELIDPIMLCGRQFGLRALDDDGTLLHLDRHRLFESSIPLVPPVDCRPHNRRLQVAGAYGGARRNKDEARNVRHGGYVPSLAIQQRLLGIDWITTEKGMAQAIPPVYTEFVGHQLLEHVAVAA